MEHDELERVTMGALDKVITGLDAHLVVQLSWQGERLDRLLDADHAKIQNALAQLLERAGWLVRVEASFNHFGDRGRYDLLAFHQATRILLVIEIKTVIGDLQDTLGRLDTKVRLARHVSRAFGWPADTVVPGLVLLESRTQRRHLERHAALFARFAARGRDARNWLSRPHADITGLLMFMRLPTDR